MGQLEVAKPSKLERHNHKDVISDLISLRSMRMRKTILATL
jgi:hypothetical protein